jgi:hypothetical protein
LRATAPIIASSSFRVAAAPRAQPYLFRKTGSPLIALSSLSGDGHSTDRHSGDRHDVQTAENAALFGLLQGDNANANMQAMTAQTITEK